MSQRMERFLAGLYLAGCAGAAWLILDRAPYDRREYAALSTIFLGILLCSSILLGWRRLQERSIRLPQDPAFLVQGGLALLLLVQASALAVRLGQANLTAGREVAWIILAGVIPAVFWYGLPRRRMGEVGLIILLVLSSPLFQVEALRDRTHLPILLLAALLERPLTRVLLRRRRPTASLLPLLPLTIFLAVLLVSSVASEYPYGSLRAWLLLLGQGALAYLVWDRLREEPWFPRLRLAVVIGGAGASLVGIGVAARRVAVLGLSEGLGIRIWAGPVPPNYLAFYNLVALALVATASLVQTEDERWVRWERWGLRAAGLVMLVYVALSYSRVAWLGLILEGLIWLGLTRPVAWVRFRTLVALSALVLLLLLLGLSGSLGLQNRIQATFDLAGDPRIEVWNEVLPLVERDPILGTGLDTKRLVYPALRGANRPFIPAVSPYMLDAHSLYLELLTATGVLGLGSGLLFLGLALRSALGRISRGEDPGWCAAVAAALVMVLLDGVVNFRLLVQDNGHLIFLLAILAVAPLRPRSAAAGKGLSRLLGPLLALAVAAGSIPDVERLMIHRGLEAVRDCELSDSEPACRKARRLFSRAIRLVPLDAHPHFLLGTWEANYGNPSEAEREFRASVRHCPGQARYWDSLAMVVAAQDREEEALALVGESLRRDPYPSGAIALIHRVRLLVKLNRRSQAKEAMTHALILAPDLVTSPFQTGLETLYPGFLEETLQQLRELAAEDDPGRSDVDPILTERLGQVLERLERSHEAAGIYRRAYRQQGYSHRSTLQLVQLLIRNGRLQEAQDILEERLKFSPRDGLLRNELGVILYLRGDLIQALQEFQRSIQEWPSVTLDNYLAHRLSELCLQGLGQPVEAAREHRKVDLIESDLSHQIWEAKLHFSDDANELGQLENYRSHLLAVEQNEPS